ncbi:probable cytochrome P450 6a23 isoform X2 [Cylas formicarius]|nr:probable cytochrome P450 6a23 isoform X2 [Cylas formicarius]
MSYGIESKEWYDELKGKGHKFGGIWDFSKKALILVDPQLIKDVLTKDFNHFSDRDVYCNEKYDPINSNLFLVPTHSWRPLRQRLTPTFTTGKIKTMRPLIVKTARHMIDYLKTKDSEDIDIKEVLQCYTIDVIANCAFGLDLNSFADPDSEFRKWSKKIFEPTFARVLKFIMIRHFPEECKRMGVCVAQKGVPDFFADVVRNVWDYRKENGFSRSDFMQMLIELHEGSRDDERPFTFEQMVANTLMFFVAGFDTSATTLTFVLYELAKHPDVQEKAREEVRDFLSKHDSELTYEAIHDMTYLSQVISEAHRLYPPVPTLSRVCINDYKISGSDVTIEKGTPIVVSVLGLGADPEYFPEPNKFDPERFSPSGSTKNNTSVHMPFGLGPRNCIGLRFGIMEVKLGLAMILDKFEVCTGPLTKIPVTLDPNTMLLSSVERVYIRLKTI